jgi:thymidylate kinase
MIINIRGTSGSGKSTVVFNLMRHYKELGELYVVIQGPDGFEQVSDLSHEGAAGQIGYQIGKWNSNLHPYKVPLRIVGKYLTPCGGCDGIKTQDEVTSRVRRWHQQDYHVLFEGLLISTIVGRWADLAESLSLERERMMFVFLNTPEEMCVERVKSRRLAKGNNKTLDETNTRDKWRLMARVRDKLLERQLDVREMDGEELTRRLIANDWL